MFLGHLPCCSEGPQKQEILTEAVYFLATWELAGQGQCRKPQDSGPTLGIATLKF